MFYFVLVVSTFIVFYKTVTRDTDEPEYAVAGIFLGGVLAIIQAILFWADAWYWNLIGFAITALDVLIIVSWIQPTADKAGAIIDKPAVVGQEPRTSTPVGKSSPTQKSSTNTISDIEFDYRDASDNASHRRVEVHSIDDEYFEGFCHKAMATRTFVIGRVRGKVLDRDTGELLPPKKWASGVRNDPRNSGVVESRGWKSPDDIEEEERELPIEILFTGFSKERRAELEEQAAIFDLVVRKNVTKGLKYLCAGPNAGPAKLAKAEAAGVEIIDESEFMQLLIKC